MRTAWGSIKGCSARQQLKPKWSCLEHHQNVSMRENIFSLPLVFSLTFHEKPLTFLEGHVFDFYLASTIIYLLFMAPEDGNKTFQPHDHLWLKSERLKKSPGFLCFAYVFLAINAFEGLHLVSAALLAMFVGLGRRNSAQSCAWEGMRS